VIFGRPRESALGVPVRLQRPDRGLADQRGERAGGGVEGWVEGDAEEGVVVRQRADGHDVPVGVGAGARPLPGSGRLGAHLPGGGLVLGVSDRGAAGPDPFVSGHQLVLTRDGDQDGGGDPVDEPADRGLTE